ncbi:Polyphosphate kinase 2 (PPK2) [Corynebacterium kalinowskii]|uniref:Polyphosphate kinase 2 (PPK2) n=1 Tax=Corynebacterium kalinowskii TaxID=2675216 RepID=A0A6B8VGH4_9CORY|nr:PPK2 family polyphosphate kinase [Corynebacterium kalinowskii]QGU02109.1 Polyphosphate kinase 2 (PPK2) [Corynebacterium kalinowskii]
MSTFTIAEAKALVDPTIDPTSTPGFKASKENIERQVAEIEPELRELQEKLYANFRSGNNPGNILIVLQGMDTSGKGGVVKHTLDPLDPQGVHITGFGKPTKEELSHDFLWRIRKALPGPGKVGIFDRSHYEDVIVHRVHELSSPEEIERRYDAINEFEKELVDGGTTIIKVFLHISKEFQKENLTERLEDPTKYWKYNPGDVDERGHWDAYQEAYRIAFEKTSTDVAPWYIVPSDNKPYARMVVKFLLLDALRSKNLEWPAADFDVEVEKARVAAS